MNCILVSVLKINFSSSTTKISKILVNQLSRDCFAVDTEIEKLKIYKNTCHISFQGNHFVAWFSTKLHQSFNQDCKQLLWSKKPWIFWKHTTYFVKIFNRLFRYGNLFIAFQGLLGMYLLFFLCFVERCRTLVGIINCPSNPNFIKLPYWWTKIYAQKNMCAIHT